MTQSNVVGLFDTKPAAKAATGPASEAEAAAFQAFWMAYPKHVDKPLAKSKFLSIIRGGFVTKTFDKDADSYVQIELDATAEELIQGAKDYTRSLLDMNTFKRKVEDKYIPSPAVWLNKGRWMI